MEFVNEIMYNNIIKDSKYFEIQKTHDSRGYFSKFYNSAWSNTGNISVAETFLTYSDKGTIRGMHLQVGKFSNDRLVTVISGKIFDVLIDLRRDSESYGQIQIQELSAEGTGSVFIPKGVAHGFQAVEKSITYYLSTEVYHPDFDAGINIESFQIPWPIRNSIISKRDLALPNFSNFNLL